MLLCDIAWAAIWKDVVASCVTEEAHANFSLPSLVAVVDQMRENWQMTETGKMVFKKTLDPSCRVQRLTQGQSVELNQLKWTDIVILGV